MIKRFIEGLPDSVKICLVVCAGVALLIGGPLAIFGNFGHGIMVGTILFLSSGAIAGGIVYGVSKGYIE